MGVLRVGRLIDELSITAEFWRGHAASLICLVSLALSIVLGYFVFRPFSWRQLLNRCPLFLVTGGVLLTIAVDDLPEALPGTFEKYLGHSLFQMVYRQEGSGITFGELWINRWGESVGTAFRYLILAAAVWAVVNLVRKRAVRANALALVIVFGWVCVIVWAMSVSALF